MRETRKSSSVEQIEEPADDDDRRSDEQEGQNTYASHRSQSLFPRHVMASSSNRWRDQKPDEG